MGVLDLFRLDGQVALVTGGASGLGVVFAETMAELGASVAVLDVDGEGARAVADRLAQQYGCRTLALQADVSNPAELEQAMARAVEVLGGLDVVFANAGIVEPGGFITDFDDNEWDRTLAVNLKGVYLTDKYAARHMIPRRRGRIINVASTYGLVGDFGLGALAYTAAKAGVVNLTRTLAIQLAPYNIRVNAIAPAFTATNLSHRNLGRLDPEARARIEEEIRRRTPLGRRARPEELKGIAAFLASDASSYCTGYTYAVDGGFLAW